MELVHHPRMQSIRILRIRQHLRRAAEGGSRSLVARSLRVLALLGLLAGFAAPGLVSAQQDVADARSCTTIANDVARLACYDQAFGVEEPEPAARVAPPPRGADVGNGNASLAEPPVVEREIPAPRSSPSSASRSAPSADKRSSTEKAPDVEITVVEVRRHARINDVTFLTDDGQAWRQTDGRRMRLPDPPFRAVISEGALGSHFLAPVGQTGSVRVTLQR